MKLKLSSVGVSLLAATSAFAAPPEMNDYSRGVTVNVPVLQPLVETTLPDEVYQAVTRADLADLRVFNASGTPVAHAFCRSPQTSAPVVAGQSLPVFPLTGAAVSAAEGSRVEVQTASGTQVRVEEARTEGGAGTTDGSSHIIDARGVAREQVLRAIQFDWSSPDGASEAKVRIESSDDLDRWTVVVSTSTLLRITQGSQQLKRERIELPQGHYQYLRVARADGGPPLLVNAVTAELASPPADIEPLWFTPNAVATAERDVLLFDTARRAPVTYARLRMPQENSSVRVTLQSRPDPKSPWLGRWSGEVYLIAADAERREGPLAQFNATTDRYWRVQMPKDAAVQPSVELGYRPLRLRFLGQGPAPFTIAFGSRRASLANPAPCDGLLADVSAEDRRRLVGAGYIGPLQTLGGELALKPPPKQTPVRLVVLWSVLIAGVAVLVAMALTLLRRLTSLKQ